MLYGTTYNSVLSEYVWSEKVVIKLCKKDKKEFLKTVVSQVAFIGLVIASCESLKDDEGYYFSKD